MLNTDINMINVAVIGLGYMGSTWVKVISESEHFHPAACIDNDITRHEKLREKTGIQNLSCYDSIQRAFSEKKIDLAVVATPAFTHHEVCMELFDKQIDIILEKPLETDWQKAKKIVEMAEKKNVTLLIDQNYRFTAPFCSLKKTISSGVYGNPGFAVVIHHRNRKGQGTYQQNMPDAMLLDMSTHHFDAMRFLFDKEVLSVTAHCWNPYWSDYKYDANVDLLIEFEDDLWITYSGSNIARGITIHPFGNWRIECERGGIYMQSHGFDLDLFCVPVNSAPKYSEKIELINLPLQNQAALLEHYRTCAEKNLPAAISGKDNLNTLVIAMAVIESSRRQEKVQIKELLQ